MKWNVRDARTGELLTETPVSRKEAEQIARGDLFPRGTDLYAVIEPFWRGRNCNHIPNPHAIWVE